MYKSYKFDIVNSRVLFTITFLKLAYSPTLLQAPCFIFYSLLLFYNIVYTDEKSKDEHIKAGCKLPTSQKEAS